MEFSKRLKDLMKRDYKRQCDVVNETGLSKASIINYLAGRTTPSETSIKILAKYFDVSEEYMKGNSEHDGELKDTIEDIQWISNYTGLSPNAIRNLHTIKDKQVRNNSIKAHSNSNILDGLNEMLHDEWAKDFCYYLTDYTQYEYESAHWDFIKNKVPNPYDYENAIKEFAGYDLKTGKKLFYIIPSSEKQYGCLEDIKRFIEIIHKTYTERYLQEHYED